MDIDCGKIFTSISKKKMESHFSRKKNNTHDSYVGISTAWTYSTRINSDYAFFFCFFCRSNDIIAQNLYYTQNIIILKT